jgi:hypothetical protein
LADSYILALFQVPQGMLYCKRPEKEKRMLQIQVLDAKQNVLKTSHESGDGVALVYSLPYQKGDTIQLSTEKSGLYSIQLDETVGTQVVYIDKTASYTIPIDPQEKTCFSPVAFSGTKHLLTLCPAPASYSELYRNLACNPYDNHQTTGLFPHATANVETRNEMVFAARNAIDGILENRSHGNYPYQSWGINQNPNAELTLHFGRPVAVDTVRLTLRSDFPHDSYWTEAKLTFSDKTTFVCALQKSPLPQSFKIGEKTITSIKIGNLIKADDASPFPALTQIEVFGTDKTL